MCPHLDAEFHRTGGSIGRFTATAKAINDEIQNIISAFRGTSTNLNHFTDGGSTWESICTVAVIPATRTTPSGT